MPIMFALPGQEEIPPSTDIERNEEPLDHRERRCELESS